MEERIKVIYRNFTTNNKLRSGLLGTFILFLFLIILLFNIKTPMIGDDFTYSLIFDTDQKITSLSDIVTSQIIHYNIWGGRVVVHTIAQLLLFADPLIADVINTAAFIVLVFLIYLHINAKNSFSISLFIGIFLLVWFMEPFGETVLWITGSANYMWGTIILLLFMLPYRLYGNRRPVTLINNILKAFGMLLFGIIAGWTNENLAGGMLVMVVLFMVYYKRIDLLIPLWAFTGLIGAIVGYILMIGAPGNFVRSADIETNFFVLVYRFIRHTQSFFNFAGLVNLIVVILAAYIYGKKNAGFKNFISLPAIYFLGVLASVYIMVFSPAFPIRAWFGVIVYNLIVLGILIMQIKDPILLKIKYGFVAFGLILFSFNLFDINVELNYVENFVRNREIVINTAVEKGEETVVLPRYYTRSKYAVSDAVYSAPLLSRYYGIDIIFSCD